MGNTCKKIDRHIMLYVQVIIGDLFLVAIGMEHEEQRQNLMEGGDKR
jgi:hypothetical protein